MVEASSLQWNGDYAPEGSGAEGAEQVSERSEESCVATGAQEPSGACADGDGGFPVPFLMLRFSPVEEGEIPSLDPQHTPVPGFCCRGPDEAARSCIAQTTA